MAIACKWQARRYNRPGFDSSTFDVYAIAGDGCPDGGSLSRSRLARRPLGLDNLCWIYDNNHITIDGRPTSPTTMTSPPASWATAGTSPGLATPTTPS